MDETGTKGQKGRKGHVPDVARDLIFGLPNNIFSPVSSPARRAYARLLLRISREFLDVRGGLPQLSQVQLTGVVSDLMASGEDFGLDEFAPDSHNSQMSAKPANVYRRLVDSGWFSEVTIGFETYATIPRAVAQLLSSLNDIDEGESINFRGSLQMVQTVLDRVAESPFDGAMLLEQATRSAESFNRSMTILLEDIRANERDIMKSASVEELVTLFFDRFVASLVTDYKALKGRHNPRRIANAVIARTHTIEAEPEIALDIARGYVEFGLATDIAVAEQMVSGHLDVIRRVFSGVGKVLDQIDQARMRVEDRFLRAVKFSRSSNDDALSALSVALESLGRAAGVDVVDSISSPLVFSSSPFGPGTMRMPPSAKTSMGRVRMTVQEQDPEITRSVDERNAQARALSVNPDELTAFIEDMLSGSDRTSLAVDGEGGVREMILLAKARQIETFEEGRLSEKYGFVQTGGLHDGYWSFYAAGDIVRGPAPAPQVKLRCKIDEPVVRARRTGVRSKLR